MGDVEQFLPCRDPWSKFPLLPTKAIPASLAKPFPDVDFRRSADRWTVPQCEQLWEASAGASAAVIVAAEGAAEGGGPGAGRCAEEREMAQQGVEGQRAEEDAASVGESAASEATGGWAPSPSPREGWIGGAAAKGEEEEEGMEDDEMDDGGEMAYGDEDHGMEDNQSGGPPPLEPLMSAVARLKESGGHTKERLRKMDETLSHGDVLIIGETHITPTKCPPRQLKGVSSLKQEFQSHSQNDISVNPVGNHYGMDMNYRMDMQRKMENERLRIKSIDRLKTEPAYNDPMVNMRHSAPYATNSAMPNNMPQQVQQGDYSMMSHHYHDGDHMLASHQQDVSGMPGVGVPNLPPELHLKMLTCPDFKKYTNMLLVAVFGRDVLASHCLNGSKGSSKPRLDRDKVTRVIATVMQKFDVPASTVREAIRVKLNNEDKLKKRARRATLAMLPQ